MSIVSHFWGPLWYELPSILTIPSFSTTILQVTSSSLAFDLPPPAPSHSFVVTLKFLNKMSKGKPCVLYAANTCYYLGCCNGYCSVSWSLQSPTGSTHATTTDISSSGKCRQCKFVYSLSNLIYRVCFINISLLLFVFVYFMVQMNYAQFMIYAVVTKKCGKYLLSITFTTNSFKVPSVAASCIRFQERDSIH